MQRLNTNVFERLDLVMQNLQGLATTWNAVSPPPHN